MNNETEKDIKKDVEEVIIEQEAVEQLSEEKIQEEKVTSQKTIKDYLSKDLFSDIKVISGKEEESQDNSDASSDDHFEEYEGTFNDISENQIISAKVIGISDSDIMVDIGFKSEGLITRSEFNNQDLPEIGSNIDIFLEKFEDRDGNITLSKYKADFIKRWDELKELCDNTEPVKGKIVKRVKGGLVVDLGVIQAFLPGSQADVHPIKNFDELIDKEFDFQIVKVDELRKNLVVSRKAILEESLNEKRQELMTKIEVGAQLQGIVKNITDFGAFVDLGGVDGLIHITDFSWGRINHPSEIVSIGDEITVQIIEYNEKTSRISLGLKQLVENPWQSIPDRYAVGDVLNGRIVSIMNYGIFIEIEKGIEGLIHISEISWTKNIQNLQDQYKVGDSLESKILFIDINEQKISLGIKQLTEDPWNNISSQVSVGDKKKGTVNKITKFGAYIDLGEDIEGFLRNTEFDWKKTPSHPKELLNEGDTVEFIVIDISDKDRKILLSIKDLTESPWPSIEQKYSSGDKLKGTISAINDSGIIVEMDDNVVGFVPSDKISKELKKDYLTSIEPGDTIDLLVVEVSEQDKNVILMLDQPDVE